MGKIEVLVSNENKLKVILGWLVRAMEERH